MSNFSIEWLALRAPADTAARDAGLLAAAAALAPRRVMDLGCGTGATLAALQPHLASPALWVLVDGDEILLAEAARRAHAMNVAADCLLRDLLVDPLPDAEADLVTATALFDLVSAAWLNRFLDALAARRLPLYAALSYDGAMMWEPAHPMDRAVTGSFNRHQLNDKGFGFPALGPTAPLALIDGLQARGYSVQQSESPWHIDAEQGALTAALLGGIAAAVEEEGSLPKVDAWHAARRASTVLTCVSHRDILAVPG